ncbi:hypothetical protein [Prochlorococcus marinus]|uniref:Uncharacterized protein n=1 Tax=Prochlorococcus marinus XMU1408 TaxID=2213228 RepID=A0A318R3W7_PROMR|nr:hypothetical protein [Prochlorococcus marinus]MBW3041724.1 hypothetical protein [Prochlorococcus marinus str. XMU1408]PYE02870.1 hypothetical protein DNJ73_03740 [Prochlorococcus marinus XMU1408]
MPSIRKRIGYLPSVNIQKIISKIASKEKLSQSKVVGILVEEALLARGEFDLQNTNDLNRENRYEKEKSITNTSIKYHELDELISDKGITYNTKRYRRNLDDIFIKNSDELNEELFDQFKQFILLKKKIQEK